MEYTYLYYGKYSEDNSGTYQMAVAYFFVMFSCFTISLLAIVRFDHFAINNILHARKLSFNMTGFYAVNALNCIYIK